MANKRLEETDPAKVGRILERANKPFRKESIERIAIEEGVTANTARNIIKRNTHVLAMQTNSNAPETFDEFLPKLRQKSYELIDIPSEAIEEASVRDRAVAAAVMMDKAFILEGRPSLLVGHVHDHRLLLGDMGDQLADALRGGVKAALPDYVDAETEDDSP